MQPELFSAENYRSLAFFKYPVVNMLADQLKSYRRGGAFRIKLVKRNLNSLVKIFKVFVAPAPGSPVDLSERRFVIIFIVNLIYALI